MASETPTTERAIIPQAERPYGIRHDPAIIRRVAELIEAGHDYATIASMPGMPSVRSVERMVSESSDLAALRACARRVDAERYVAEGLAIVDEPLPDDPKLASASVTRAKNRADFRAWMAKCMDRLAWGDAVQMDARVQLAVIELGAILPTLTKQPDRDV